MENNQAQKNDQPSKPIVVDDAAKKTEVAKKADAAKTDGCSTSKTADMAKSCNS